MGFSIHDFLERMCDEVQYKSVHKDLWDEIKSHIEEMAEEYEAFGYDHDTSMNMAASRMGNAREIGEMFNKHYRLPFNKRYGLMIWSALVTILIYLGYPLIYKINNYTINFGRRGSLVIFAILALFAVINVLYLRRGELRITLRDFGWITLGFFAGWAAVIAVLLIAGAFSTPWHYAYFPDVKIPIAPVYVPLLPKNEMVFGVEYFCIWFCFIFYMVAVKSRKKIPPFSLVAGWFRISDGKVMENADVLINARDTDGRKVSMVFLGIMGLRRDKYGEKKKGVLPDDY
ncbi:MAG: hypothetical protein J1F01_00220 [Oscillospiraceae bacterium]|nr:hypothetical protein [Oscillospiraceae bacterium]